MADSFQDFTSNSEDIDEAGGYAEAAVTVADEWQGRGIGTVLLELLALTAAGNGVTEFRAYIGQDNDPAKSLLANLGAVGHNEEGLWVVEVGLPLPSSPIRDTALHQVLVAVARGELDIEQRS